MPEEKENSSSIPFVIVGDIPLRVGDASVNFKSGCSVLELALTPQVCKKPAFLEFENYYTSKISVRVKGVFEDSRKEEWRTVLKDYILMADPHSENGSQNSFRIDMVKEFFELPAAILAMRIILRQPSPHWQRFSIENVKLLPCTSNGTAEELTTRNGAVSKDNEEEELLSYGLVLNSVTSKLEQIADMRTKLRALGSSVREESGRFEVDGSYEVNLLSYT